MQAVVRAVLWLLAGLLTSTGAVAQAADSRAHITLQRQAVERRHAADQAVCARQFAVTTCSEQARLRRRDELVLLQKAEAALEVRERRLALQLRPSAPLGAAPAPASAASKPARVSRRAADIDLETLPSTRAGVNSAASKPAAVKPRAPRPGRQAYDERQQQAQAHREKVEARNAARAASGAIRSAPLPPPAAASASRG